MIPSWRFGQLLQDRFSSGRQLPVPPPEPHRNGSGSTGTRTQDRVGVYLPAARMVRVSHSLSSCNCGLRKMATGHQTAPKTSGRSSSRGMPVQRSTSTTRSMGIRCHPWIDWRVRFSWRASLACPPAALIARCKALTVAAVFFCIAATVKFCLSMSSRTGRSCKGQLLAPARIGAQWQEGNNADLICSR